MEMSEIIEKFTEKGLDLPYLEDMVFPAIPAALGARFGQEMFGQLTVHSEIITGANKTPIARENVLNALGSIGSAVDPTVDDAPNDHFFYFQTRAGWLNANPALICVIDLSDNQGGLQAAAFAKEGLISQKTALKAVARFKKALAGQGIEFTDKVQVSQTKVVDLIVD